MNARIASTTITTVPAIIPCVPGCSCVDVEDAGGAGAGAGAPISPGDTVIVAVGVIGIDDIVGL